MNIDKQTSLTVPEALNLLKEHSCIKPKNIEMSEAEKESLRQAILLIVNLSDSENLGICADDASGGFAALFSYLKALGYQFNFDRAAISATYAPIYIKFNTQKMSYFVDSYSGQYRGVLISCRSEDDTIVGTYGHFPLDLFN